MYWWNKRNSVLVFAQSPKTNKWITIYKYKFDEIKYKVFNDMKHLYQNGDTDIYDGEIDNIKNIDILFKNKSCNDILEEDFHVKGYLNDRFGGSL